MTKIDKQEALKQIDELKKFIEECDKKESSERWKPEHGERYFFISESGKIRQETVTSWEDDSFDKGVYDFNNCFKTKEEAELHKLRLESMANRWMPEGRYYFMYLLHDGKVCEATFYHSYDFANFWIGNCHRTEEDARAWGEKYAKAFSLVNS